ncbi:hypothetical protein [Mesorhizobium sp. M00.F.Ca.ET.217.01.1.1]|uniref:hypothetical protein n=1 Tax=Mesorhizobium sp. M00.F.Ca.ET.217.01.1.1 TaxID=2500529 RepID=UPI000FD776D5|nr:hypothetical protein [Mesorhizobium sp. M00.F.Ca.ET.217.01.1.1]TGQ19267.1 hypothetical protein EN860_019230 [Mesorhizobium sp. M00.F.Ca.ET.217.01.1.1]
MRMYLAHPVTDYGTKRQADAVSLIHANGWAVENPNQPHHEAAYKQYGMAHFAEVVEGCDGLAFLRFPSGAIGAGVAREVETALRCCLPVWDVSGGKLVGIGTMMPFPVLTVDETRALIAEIRANAA